MVLEKGKKNKYGGDAKPTKRGDRAGEMGSFFGEMTQREGWFAIGERGVKKKSGPLQAGTNRERQAQLDEKGPCLGKTGTKDSNDRQKKTH